MLKWHSPLWSSPTALPIQFRFFLRPRFLAIILIALFLESIWHQSGLRVPRPVFSSLSDRPFQHGCAIPDESAPRANATIVMMARNDELEEAFQAIASLEQHFNRWYKYPVLFLNNEPWDEEFQSTIANATSGEVTFEVIPEGMWSFPDWIDPEEARKSMLKQEEDGIAHAGLEGYHHMCRFYSGFFYDLPALQKYRWYWRLDPDSRYTCSITYDPFVEMEKRNKKYGYTIALWEIGKTAPSLFRLASEYKKLHNAGTTLWKAMVDASWAPWPFRYFMSWLPHRNADGDAWNFCHYWSNFEIADMNFFRSDKYRDFFEFLDRGGGFFFERYGDAAVHSLAAGLFLQPHEIHHFEDFGYEHDGSWIQPDNAVGLQLPGHDLSSELLAEEKSGGIGCRCKARNEKLTNLPDTCFRRLGDPIRPY